MKKPMKRALTVALAAAMLAPAGLGYAASFKDVSANHWAYRYIDDLSRDHVINGYPDNSYRPDKEVSFLEVMKLLYGIVSPSQSDISSARSTFRSTVQAAGVPDWAEDSVALALSKGYLSSDQLQNAKTQGLISNQPSRVPDRNFIAVAFGKALSLREASLTDQATLQHKDLAKIPEATKKYLIPLVKEGIFDATGSDGNFEGNRGIRRAEMAKITYLSQEYAAKAKSSKEVKGTVTLVSTVANQQRVFVKVGNETLNFNVDKDTKITVNDKAATFSTIKEGQEITLTYVESSTVESGRLVKTISLKEVLPDGYAYFKGLGNTYNTYNTYNRYNTYAANTLNVQYTKDVSRVNLVAYLPNTVLPMAQNGTFTYDATTSFSVFGQSINVRDLKTDDLFSYKMKTGDVLDKVEVIPRTSTVTGTVISAPKQVPGTRYDEFTLRVQGGAETKFYVENLNNLSTYSTNYYVQRQDYDRLMNSLRENQVVTLNLNYNVVTVSNNATIRDGQYTVRLTNFYNRYGQDMAMNSAYLTDLAKVRFIRTGQSNYEELPVVATGVRINGTAFVQPTYGQSIGQFADLVVRNGMIEEIRIRDSRDLQEMYRVRATVEGTYQAAASTPALGFSTGLGGEVFLVTVRFTDESNTPEVLRGRQYQMPILRENLDQFMNNRGSYVYINGTFNPNAIGRNSSKILTNDEVQPSGYQWNY